MGIIKYSEADKIIISIPFTEVAFQNYYKS